MEALAGEAHTDRQLGDLDVRLEQPEAVHGLAEGARKGLQG
jgi:hypothetical protein